MKIGNPIGGYFLVIEGPSGVGKSTSIALLEKRLTDYGVKVLIAKEPKSSEDKLCGLDLLNRIVCDRRDYLKGVIIPALMEGYVVILDRYIPSSLVYQRIDGVTIEEIWKLNKDFLKPSMTIYLYASKEVLEQRIAERSVLTRFENASYRDQEIEFYKQARDLIATHDWQVTRINTATITTEDIIEIIISDIFTSLLSLPSI